METKEKYITLFSGKTANIVLPWSYGICFIIATFLLVVGFFAPPIGVIDGSCLTAVGEYLLFPTIMYAFRALEMGMKIKLQKGDASIEIEHKEE